jgi:hypothetical protein
VELSLDSHATSSSCRLRNAASETWGMPTLMLAQVTVSNFQAAIIVTLPGASST